ncbi:unnamed protein product [Arctia plantaginis]|uniref:Uncharacterized protein n=1 Tax=Arctia plantaginis TaxID=874455 RepID=A0A8S1B8J1_ARCPL|nr:unnamed protein product [Arctia plantaginis]
MATIGVFRLLLDTFSMVHKKSTWDSSALFYETMMNTKSSEGKWEENWRELVFCCPAEDAPDAGKYKKISSFHKCLIKKAWPAAKSVRSDYLSREHPSHRT